MALILQLDTNVCIHSPICSPTELRQTQLQDGPPSVATRIQKEIWGSQKEPSRYFSSPPLLLTSTAWCLWNLKLKSSLLYPYSLEKPVLCCTAAELLQSIRLTLISRIPASHFPTPQKIWPDGWLALFSSLPTSRFSRTSITQTLHPFANAGWAIFSFVPFRFHPKSFCEIKLVERKIIPWEYHRWHQGNMLHFPPQFASCPSLGKVTLKIALFLQQPLLPKMIRIKTVSYGTSVGLEPSGAGYHHKNRHIGSDQLSIQPSTLSSDRSINPSSTPSFWKSEV